VLVQLPSNCLPPERSLLLGLLPLAHRGCRTELHLMLLCMPGDVVHATANFVLQNKLKQTVLNHFAYELKHGSMN
jgi:hypothetical protein